MNGYDDLNEKQLVKLKIENEKKIGVLLDLVIGYLKKEQKSKIVEVFNGQGRNCS